MIKPKSKSQWDRMKASAIKKWQRGLKSDDSYGRNGYRNFIDKIMESDPICKFMFSHFGEYDYEKKCKICPLDIDTKHECGEEFYTFSTSNTLQQFLAVLPPMINLIEAINYKDYIRKVKEYNLSEANW